MEVDFYTAKDIHIFQTKRSITSLYKSFLNLLEDLNQDRAIPPQKFAYLRKKVLDAGNEAQRGFEEQVKNFEITFGKKETQ